MAKQKDKWNWNWRTNNNSWYDSNYSSGDPKEDRETYLDVLYDAIVTYWDTLASAVVEDAAPTKLVLTFSTADTGLIASDFKMTDFVIVSLSRNEENTVLTLTLNKAVVSTDTLTVYLKEACSSAVTNNVA